MKRDERNQLSRRRILDEAIREFGKHGYGLGSVNNICAEGGISKGILYHYYSDRDALYLACVSELITGLTEHISHELDNQHGSVAERLERYFAARMSFFNERPMHHRLFCEISISPPPQLAEAIRKMKAPIDELNERILTEMLREEHLRPNISVEDAVETFRMYQDFINARLHASQCADPVQREIMCRRSIDILLYGVIERGYQK